MRSKRGSAGGAGAAGGGGLTGAAVGAAGAAGAVAAATGRAVAAISWRSASLASNWRSGARSAQAPSSIKPPAASTRPRRCGGYGMRFIGFHLNGQKEAGRAG
ncbi:MAG: hypothetical protein C0505_00790 [Leptothrix sp. (in: Bacteria)]|nr:hypothetical protein [Leptothrix sp. (in: b-proteobacteria)]